jgi:hypothetical protein
MCCLASRANDTAGICPGCFRLPLHLLSLLLLVFRRQEGCLGEGLKHCSDDCFTVVMEVNGCCRHCFRHLGLEVGTGDKDDSGEERQQLQATKHIQDNHHQVNKLR